MADGWRERSRITASDPEKEALYLNYSSGTLLLGGIEEGQGRSWASSAGQLHIL